jgi:hypothetical protein
VADSGLRLSRPRQINMGEKVTIVVVLAIRRMPYGLLTVQTTTTHGEERRSEEERIVSYGVCNE